MGVQQITGGMTEVQYLVARMMLLRLIKHRMVYGQQ
jgi:hypothetical protein